MPEFYKGPEHIDFDIRAWEIKENELNPKNGVEIQNKSTTFEIHLNKRSIDKSFFRVFDRNSSMALFRRCAFLFAAFLLFSFTFLFCFFFLEYL